MKSNSVAIVMRQKSGRNTMYKLEGKWEYQVVPHHNLEPMDGFDGISHNRLFNIPNLYIVTAQDD